MLLGKGTMTGVGSTTSDHTGGRVGADTSEFLLVGNLQRIEAGLTMTRLRQGTLSALEGRTHGNPAQPVRCSFGDTEDSRLPDRAFHVEWWTESSSSGLTFRSREERNVSPEDEEFGAPLWFETEQPFFS